MFKRFAIPIGAILWGMTLALVLPTGSKAQSPSLVGSWSPVQNLPVGPTHSILLPTGKVLFFGEFEKGDHHYEWDPATGTLLELPYAGFNIFCSGHSHLEDGTVFITGGHIDAHVGEPQSVIYDPYTRSWFPVPLMNDGRWYPTATTLPNGDVLVVGGETHAAGINNPIHQVYQPTTNTWRELTDGAANLPYYTRQFVTPDGDVIIVTPRRRSYLLTTEGAGTFANLGLLNFPGARTYGGAVMYEDGKILVVGGGVPPTETAEVIDLNVSYTGWRQVDSMSVARRQHNTVLLPDGKVLVIGGSSGAIFDDRTQPVNHAEVWDPATESWTTWASNSMYRGYHSTALLLPDGRIFVGGGRHDDTMEIFSPPYLFQGGRPTIDFAPVHVDPGQPFTVLTPDYANIEKVHLIRLGATTHAFDQNQKLSRLEFTPFTGGLIAVAPASNSLVPPGPYMLFLVDSAGVPSVGAFVRVNNTTLPPIGVGLPGGGEVLLSDTHSPIKYWARSPTTHVDLAFSVDDGTSWQTIATNVPNTGTYSWAIPTLISSDMRVRIRDSADPGRQAVNPAPFSIYPGPMESPVPFGSVWKYHADGTFPGTGWELPGFPDGAWASGPGKLGYGRGNEATTLPKTDPSQTSVYFRKQFTVGQSVVLGAELKALYDDGIAVWLNGNPILERHMASGLAHSKYASASVNDETHTILVDPALFVPGTNTLAAMVKQNGRTSPDLAFDLSLSVMVPQTFSIDLLSPQGGKFGVGRPLHVEWEWTGYVPTVDLAWSSNGKATWQTIASGVPNTGSYEWTLPSAAAPNVVLRVSKSSDPSVFAESAPFAVAVPTTVQAFDMGSAWRYWDPDVNPGETWNLVGFADGAWPTGAGPFGYGVVGLATLLQKTVPSQTSVYFRKVVQLPYVAGATITARYDDGIAVWINGHHVLSENVGSLRHEKYALSSLNQGLVTAHIPADAFVAGTNVVGVMVKQNGASSPDLLFDLSLDVEALP